MLLPIFIKGNQWKTIVYLQHIWQKVDAYFFFCRLFLLYSLHKFILKVHLLKDHQSRFWFNCTVHKWYDLIFRKRLLMDIFKKF